MTDKHPLELSRRKILAGLGSIGVASAGVGLGTSAYFSDTETFTNNELVAGQLDMKVSWEEHYSDWSEDEAEFASMPGPEEEPDLSLSAPPDGKPIELVVNDWDGFMGATLQEQFPEGGLEEGADPCEALADVPDDLEAPVIDLEDVKPGDFGEVTFDFSLCDNPGYVWMNGELVSESENGLTEPEAKDPDEDQNADGSLKDDEAGPAEVELADALRARAWYDDGGSTGSTGGDDDGDTLSTMATWSFTDLTDSSLEPEDLAQVLVSDQSGVTVSNVSYAGAPEAAGTFSGGGSAVGIEEGIILSSGTIQGVAGPNDDTAATTPPNGFGNPGDSDLDALITQSTNDAAALEFDFTVPQDADQVFFNYVFGSEEYDEYVDSEYNDVFGFFLNSDTGTPEETNIAIIETPDNPGEDAVSINNINNGENTNLYVDNRSSDGGSDAGRDTQMDGFTVVLDVGPDVDPGSTNTLKLAIADAGDSVLDSWVLLEGGSLTTEPQPEGEGEAGDNIKQDSEEVFIEGSLREVLDELSTDLGVPLEGNIPAEEDGGTGRNCYSAAPDVHYVGFQWWLPIDHGNEVQTDSVTFDLGFYTEQCRHNDGEGMPTTASVTFDDQESDGTSVVVDSATLPSGGYVVIHESVDGAPGPVLGHSSYLPAVTSTGVTVQLDTPISESQELIAMAHMDDGDQQYEFPDADGPYTVNGAPVIDAAQITIPDGG